jgi:hypothetical protein
LESRLAVHHQCFRSAKATRYAASRFLQWNREVPYYLWSDAGDDFSELARSLKINYRYSDINVGHSRYTPDKLYELLARIKQTADSTGADLILWMEDDVITRKKLNIAMGVQSTCLLTTHKIWPACHELLRQKYAVEPNVPSWGMAGGSLLNGNLFRQQWPLIHEFVYVDYPHLLETCGAEVGYGDVLLQMIHMIAEIPCDVGKYVVDHCEKPFPDIPWLRNIRKYHYNQKPLVHGIKTYY